MSEVQCFRPSFRACVTLQNFITKIVPDHFSTLLSSFASPKGLDNNCQALYRGIIRCETYIEICRQNFFSVTQREIVHDPKLNRVNSLIDAF